MLVAILVRKKIFYSKNWPIFFISSNYNFHLNVNIICYARFS